MQPNIIRLGCDIAEIHHRFTEIQSALFGAASFRLALAVTLHRRNMPYRDYLSPLDQLHAQLSTLVQELPTADAGLSVQQADHLRTALSQYASTLDTAITRLHSMCEQLSQDEDGYRATPKQGQSAFNRDMIEYDHLLMELDNEGSRLNQLFARF